MKRRWIVILLAACLVPAFCMGCNKHLRKAQVILFKTPAGIEPVTVTRPDTSYKTGGLPFGWKRLDMGQADIAFENTYHKSTIFASAHCGYYKQVPLNALRNHILMDITEREIKQDETVLDNRTALRVIVTGRYDGAPIKMGLYTVQIDQCIYDLVYMSAPERFDACLTDFDEFAYGFSAKRKPYDPKEDR